MTGTPDPISLDFQRLGLFDRIRAIAPADLIAVYARAVARDHLADSPRLLGLPVATAIASALDVEPIPFLSTLAASREPGPRTWTMIGVCASGVAVTVDIGDGRAWQPTELDLGIEFHARDFVLSYTPTALAVESISTAGTRVIPVSPTPSLAALLDWSRHS